VSRRKAQATILCEDRQQEVFVRHYLMQRGFDRGSIRSVPLPMGSQAGEQFVRHQYPGQLKEHRRSHVSRYLVVMMDADTVTVGDRQKELDGACQSAGVAPRAAADNVAIFVPKRNIETWIHYLEDEDVNEQDAYRKLKRPSDCLTGVRKLAKTCPMGLPADAPQSLQNTRTEWQRTFR